MIYDPQAHGAQCPRCPLNGATPVPPTPAANGKPRLIIIGEGPGSVEVNRGECFIGPSGRMLNGVLRQVGFDRAEAHISNATLCKPERDSDVKEAIPRCAPRLARELSQLDPAVPILALGAPATRVTLGKAGIMKARGFVWHSPKIRETALRAVDRRIEKAKAALETATKKTKAKLEMSLTKALDSAALLHARALLAGRVVIPSIHPAFVLRGADGHLPLLRIDIDRAVRWARKPFPLVDKGPYQVVTTVKAARAALASFSKTVVVDIETDGVDPTTAEMTCVGICDVGDVRKAVLLDPWKKAFIPLVRAFLKNRTVVTQNGPQFDTIVLRRYGIHFGKNEDTLVAHHAFASHLPKSLAHMGSVYTDTGPWKQKFKDGAEKGIAGFGVKKEDLAEYCAADVRITALVWKRMAPDLAPERRVYELDMKMAEMYRRMTERGIRIDEGRRRELSRKMKFRAAALLGEMRSLLNQREFHPRRVADIRYALFQQLKAPTYLAPPTPTGLPAANAAVLEKLKAGTNDAATLADYIIRWRSANDVRSEYLDNVVAGADGRVHAGWGLGPVTGRPRCRGPNLLNTPRMEYCPGCGSMLVDGMTHKETCKPKKRRDPQPEAQIRDVYIPAEGCVFVYFDLSQAEMRFAANISGDAAFIESCKGDVHAGNAKIIFGGIPAAVEALEKDPKGAGKKFRDVAKNCGFAISYLAEAEKLFMHLIEHGFDVDMAVCSDIISRIHSAYWRYYEFVEENVRLCKKQGFLRTPFLGRKRWLGYYPKPTEVANAPIQSGVADVMGWRLLDIESRLPPSCHQLIYAYDAAIYEVPSARIKEVEDLLEEVWAEPVKLPDGRTFMQPIDRKVGDRWSYFG
jgi:uracil-DNA glycosylase family 4